METINKLEGTRDSSWLLIFFSLALHCLIPRLVYHGIGLPYFFTPPTLPIPHQFLGNCKEYRNLLPFHSVIKCITEYNYIS